MKSENLILVSMVCGFAVTCVGMLTANINMFLAGTGMFTLSVALLAYVNKVAK